jgi:ParB-like chromosome segregation protein Spo0J
MQLQKVPVTALVVNPRNPRIIRDAKFKKLVQSVRSFPQMLEIRPIVVDADMMVLGGNMRLRACIEAGFTEVPIIKASDLTEEQKAEFIIKDNVGFGEWDWEALANEWEAEQLDEWGLDVPVEKEEKYTSKIETPLYEPKKSKPPVASLMDKKKYAALIEEINESSISTEDKEFLRAAAARHVVFNFEEIAEYYAHSDHDVQQLMESSALVIIDYDKAIENGFAMLSQEIQNNFTEDYEE